MHDCLHDGTRPCVLLVLATSLPLIDGVAGSLSHGADWLPCSLWSAPCIKRMMDSDRFRLFATPSDCSGALALPLRSTRFVSMSGDSNDASPAATSSSYWQGCRSVQRQGFSLEAGDERFECRVSQNDCVRTETNSLGK